MLYRRKLQNLYKYSYMKLSYVDKFQVGWVNLHCHFSSSSFEILSYDLEFKTAFIMESCKIKTECRI